MLINAIVIPVIRCEISILIEWIEGCPALGMNVSLYLSIDNKWHESEKNILLEAFNQSLIKNCTLHFIDCDIPASQSFYNKDKSIEKFDIQKYPFGKKSGPNIQFFTTLRKLSFLKSDISNVILLETDAHPIKNNWLNELNQRMNWLGNNFYVAGSKSVLTTTIPIIKEHLNGNSIYPLGKSDFSDFLNFWEKLLLEAIKENPDLAYDVVLEWSYHASKVSGSFATIKKLWREAVEYRKGFVNISNYLANISGCSDMNDIKNYLDKKPHAIIIHGRYPDSTGKDIVKLFKKFSC